MRCGKLLALFLGKINSTAGGRSLRLTREQVMRPVGCHSFHKKDELGNGDLCVTLSNLLVGQRHLQFADLALATERFAVLALATVSWSEKAAANDRRALCTIIGVETSK